MLNARFVPADSWPGPKTDHSRRKPSPFKSTYNKTLDLLETELRAIQATEILIQCYFTRASIRNDGWPKSSSNPTEPGVIVSFERDGKNVSMPCDKFRDWTDNLRAIALSLEALRKVDRYGVTKQGEQYRGWEALPPPEPKSPEALQRELNAQKEWALGILAKHTAFSENSIKTYGVDDVVRAAILYTHPDKGGTSEAFSDVMKAGKVLKEIYGGTF
jgi:hypothetical protein